MAVGDVNVGLAFGREQSGEIAQQAVGQLHHLLGIDVHRRTVHRLQHFVGHGGGPGDRQEFPARANDHFVIPLASAPGKGCRGLA
jgi:hypothetical protein